MPSIPSRRCFLPTGGSKVHHDLLTAGFTFDLETLLKFVQTVCAVWLGVHMSNKTKGDGV